MSLLTGQENRRRIIYHVGQLKSSGADAILTSASQDEKCLLQETLLTVRVAAGCAANVELNKWTQQSQLARQSSLGDD